MRKNTLPALILSMLLGLPSFPAAGASPVVVPEISLDRLGDCQGNGKSYELSALMVLSNKWIETKDKSGKFRISVEGETVNIDSLVPRGTYHVNVGYLVDSKSDLDIDVSLAVIDNKLVVYWKETFKHKVYRHGLFGVENRRLQFVCQGHGGVTSTD